MTELGVFAVARSVFDHPLLQRDVRKEPYSRLEAWVWLLAEAAWKERRIGRVGQVVTISRGQVAHSIRFIADAWGWSKSSVERYLARLKTEAMIETEAGTASLVITICNYDTYQRVGLPERDSDGDASRDTSGTAAGQTRNIQTFKEEDNAGSGEPAKARSKPKKKSYPAEFERVWAAYPTTVNMPKKAAHAAWVKLDAEDRITLEASIPAFIAYCRSHPTYSPVYFQRFVNERRFDDYIGAGRAAAATTDDWRTRLAYARKHRKWQTSLWGPAPGQPDCLTPTELLQSGDGAGWTEWSNK